MSRYIRLALCLVLLAGCDDNNTNPSQEALDAANKRADQMAEMARQARRQSEQTQRLRDADRVRSDSEQGQLHTQNTLLKGLAFALACLIGAVIVVSALGLRRPRRFTHSDKQGESIRDP